MASRIKIIADADIPFLKGALEEEADVIYLPGRDIRNDDLRNADALIIRTRTICNESLLNNTGIKFIATATIGFDHIDTAYCEKNGIHWTNAPGCNSSSVEQYILSVLLNLADRKGFNLDEKTIGIVGVGHVGGKVENICRELGMKVLLNDPPRERIEGQDGFVELKKIQQEADIITLHVPLNISETDMTLKMGDRDFFNRLQRSPILINSSRGEVVDGETLKEALSSGRVSASVLDVWENEPDIDHELLRLTEIASPHIAGYSTDGKANGTGMSVRAISRFFGLGMDDWQPGDLPEPDKPGIIVDGTGMRIQDLLLEVSRQTYDVRKDDNSLRENPGSFEMLRKSYRVRREPGAYRVRILNDEPGSVPVLEKLGYQVLCDNCM